MSGFAKRGSISDNPSAGRSGSAWRRTRALVISRAGGCCAIDGVPVDLTARAPDPNSAAVDHHRTPYRELRRRFDAGELTAVQFTREANDPDGCRLLCFHHHQNLDRLATGASVPPYSLKIGAKAPPPTDVCPPAWPDENWVSPFDGRPHSTNWAGNSIKASEWRRRQGQTA